MVTLVPAQTGVVVTLVTFIDCAKFLPGTIPSKKTNKAKTHFWLLILTTEPIKFFA
jgi:hypothetical protein